MLGIIGSSVNDGLIVESGEPLFQLIPEAVEAFCLCGKRTASVLSFEDEPLVWKPWTIGGRHVPNPVYVLPPNRLSFSSWVFTGNIVFGHHQPIFAGHPRLWEPGFKDGDQKAQTEEPCDDPAIRITGGNRHHADRNENGRHDQREQSHRVKDLDLLHIQEL